MAALAASASGAAAAAAAPPPSASPPMASGSAKPSLSGATLAVSAPFGSDGAGGAHVSPDGTCALSLCRESRRVHLFELPLDEPAAAASSPWAPCLSYAHAEAPRSVAWYPHMDSGDPRTCVFAACSADSPVKLWDATTGALRASYVAKDSKDQVAAPMCVAFSADGASLLCGFERAVHVFDLSAPGNPPEVRATAPTRRSSGHQRGLVSALACDAAGGQLYAAGSLEPSLALYELRSGAAVCFLGRGGGDAAPLFGGVTCCRFAKDGQHLYSSGRRDGHVLKWDLRAPAAPVLRFARPADTNQRCGFDVRCAEGGADTRGELLITGGSDAKARVYDAATGDLVGALDAADAVNGAEWHPTRPLAVLAVGQRHHPAFDSDSDSDSGREEAAAAPPPPRSGLELRGFVDPRPFG